MYGQNPMQMLKAFNEFRQNFKGDPREEVQKLVSSGRISQAQLNQLQAMATEFQKAMHI